MLQICRNAVMLLPLGSSLCFAMQPRHCRISGNFFRPKRTAIAKPRPIDSRLPFKARLSVPYILRAVFIPLLWGTGILASGAVFAQDLLTTAFGKMVASQQYMAGRAGTIIGTLAPQLQRSPCKDVQGTGHYDKRSVRDCLYFFPGARPITTQGNDLVAVGEDRAEIWIGRVLMLNAPPATMATWAGVACRRANREPDKCGLALLKTVETNSAGQFPIAGIVIERDRDLDGSTDGHVSVFFKDGVTVWTDQSIALSTAPRTGAHLPGRQLTFAELEAAIADLQSESPAGLKVQNYSRITGVSAECFQDTKAPMPPVWNGKSATSEWLNVTRQVYLDAFDNPQNGYVMFDLIAAGICH